MKSKMKLNLKRITAVFCILTIMQSYFYALKNIALAVENEIEAQAIESEEATGETDDESENENVVENEVVAEESVEEETSEEEATEEVVEETEETTETETEENTEETAESQEEEETGNPQVGVEMSSKNSSIYKGYLYANVTSDLKYDTSYNTMVTLSLTDTDYIDEVLFIETDKVGLDEDAELNLNDYIYYESTKVSQEEFETVLGTEGAIKLYTEEGIYIGEITSESTVESGYYVYDYTESYNKVIVQIVNPINDGSITISNDKAITGDLIYTREQISLFKSINTYLTVSMISGENIGSIEDTHSINLEETESKMTIEIENSTLSTESENEISLNVALKTDEEKYDLFENPVVEIEFPSAIKTIEIEGINLLYKNGLSLNTWDTYTNDAGNIVLKIEMSGSQSVYTPGSATEGTNIVINATVTTHRLTSNGTQNLKMTYTNDATDRISYALEGNDAEYLELNFTGKEEVITAMSVTNQSNENSAVTYDGETTVVDIEAEGESQTINITGTILDNFSSSITDVYVIGKIPFNGNVNVEGNNYGTNFDVTLSSLIETSGLEAVIYYSEEENPDTDSESWTTDTTDVTKYKTFKIVINSEELNAGDYLSFSYSISVPENVGYNMIGFGDYVVYYKMGESAFYTSIAYELASEEKELTIEDLPEEDVIEVTPSGTEDEESGEDNEEENNEEGSGETEENSEEAILKVGTQVTYGTTELTSEDTVYERAIIKYTVVIENTSDTTINNLNIKGYAENANMYTWVYIDYDSDNITKEYQEITDGSVTYDELNAEVLQPGEAKTFSYYVMALELEDEEMYLNGMLTISADEIEEQNVLISSNKIVDAEISVTLKTSSTEGADDDNSYYTMGFVNLKVCVENISNNELENMKVVVEIPQGLYFDEDEEFLWFDMEELEYYTEYDGNTTKLIFELPYLAKGASREIDFTLYSTEMDLNILSRKLTVVSYVKTDNNIYYSNDFTRKYNQGLTSVESSWTASPNKETLEDKEEVVFEFTLKNTGLIESTISVISNFSNGFKITSVLVILGDETEELDISVDNEGKQYFIFGDNIDSEEELTITINAYVDSDYYITDQENVWGKLSVSGSAFTNFDTDVISYKINNTNVTVDYVDVTDEGDDDLDNNTTSSTNTTSTSTNTTSTTSTLTTSSNSSNTSLTSTSNEEEESATTQGVVAVYNISGNVWLDADKDGIRDSEESGIAEVPVALYGTISDGGIDMSNKISETTTDSSGAYEFTGIESGTYIVVFEYDTGVYSVTTYQLSTASSTENSDATVKTLSTGEKVALTDSLQLNGLSLINIDLGLIPLDTFDLSLSKYVTNVKVINDEGTTNYDYDNSTYSKIEIRSKYYSSSTLEITYNIVITNEGDISGYVNKIIDYLPEGMELISQDDSGWYQDEDGNLYNSDLAGTEIKSGESKTITLVVRQSLASGESMQLVNGAEIAESTNALGLIDEDSTAGNGEKSEDDYGKNTIIVSVSTGVYKIIRNVFLIIAMLAFVGMGIVFMKKENVLNNKKIK